MSERLFFFIGGTDGLWAVRQQTTVLGDALPPVQKVQIHSGSGSALPAGWVLRGMVSNERYVERDEKDRLLAVQEGLGRPAATYAALIPIRKSPAWWALTQDERRAIFEAKSHHIRIGLKYLPPIARRLHHCRDLSADEPFDFITWFEYAPGDEAAFDDLLAELRATEEWQFVEREIDIRLVRAGTQGAS